MEFRQISIKSIVQEAVRDLGVGDREIPFLDYIEWVAWGLQQIGAYSQYIEKYNCEIEIEDYQGKLPNDFYKVIANPTLTYKITGDSISTTTKNGIIKFNYLAFQSDEEGFPMIPDHASYKEALVWLIAYRLSVRDELPNKKLDPVFCKGRWDWYCKQARAKGQELDEEAKARFSRMYLGLRSSLNQYSVNFKGVDNNYKLGQKDGRTD